MLQNIYCRLRMIYKIEMNYFAHCIYFMYKSLCVLYMFWLKITLRTVKIYIEIAVCGGVI